MSTPEESDNIFGFYGLQQQSYGHDRDEKECENHVACCGNQCGSRGRGVEGTRGMLRYDATAKICLDCDHHSPFTVPFVRR
jgi:hypothetical protein